MTHDYTAHVFHPVTFQLMTFQIMTILLTTVLLLKFFFLHETTLNSRYKMYEVENIEQLEKKHQ